MAQVDTGSWPGMDGGGGAGAGSSATGDDSSLYTFVGSDGGLSSLPDAGGDDLSDALPC